jgi:nucleoside-diphosphate-sugar epimerase
MKILITGGAGFIGSNLTKYYLENTDHAITVVDRDHKNITRLQELCGTLRPFEVIHEDYDNVRNSIVWDKDAIVHLAAVPRVAFSVEHPASTTYENVYKTVRLLEQIKNTGNKNIKFVFASSSSIYGDASMPTSEYHELNPQSPYALQKKCGGEFCKMFSDLYGTNTVCLRFFNVFGPHQYVDSAYSTVMAKWCDQLKKGEPLLIEGDGTQSRDFSYVDNVIHGINLAVTSDKRFRGESYNIANQDRTSLNEILDYLSEKFDITLDRCEPRAGDVKHTQADISKAKEELNYSPVCNVWEGLEKTIEWWKLKEKIC